MCVWESVWVCVLKNILLAYHIAQVALNGQWINEFYLLLDHSVTWLCTCSLGGLTRGPRTRAAGHNMISIFYTAILLMHGAKVGSTSCLPGTSGTFRAHLLILLSQLIFNSINRGCEFGVQTNRPFLCNLGNKLPSLNWYLVPICILILKKPTHPSR